MFDRIQCIEILLIVCYSHIGNENAAVSEIITLNFYLEKQKKTNFAQTYRQPVVKLAK